MVKKSVTSYEQTQMIKREKHNLKVATMAEISGVMGMQFGKEVFSTVIKFKDLKNFLSVFPNVQRTLMPSKVKKVKKYTISGVFDPDAMRFFPAITATARGSIFYDNTRLKLAIDTQDSKLSLNDGQHRFYGIDEAITEIRKMMHKETDHEMRHQILTYLEELENMVIPITIFNNLTEAEEKQLFHDTNALAARPSKSASIRFAQTDYIAIIAREVAKENEYLLRYGVEFEKSNILEGHKNDNIILLTSIYQCIREVYKSSLAKNPDFINRRNYKEFKKDINHLFNIVFETLPEDIRDKKKYIFYKNYVSKAIFKFIHTAREAGLMDMDISDTLKQAQWVNDAEYWKPYGGQKSARGALVFAGGGDNAKNVVHDMLVLNSPLTENKDTQLNLFSVEGKQAVTA